MTDATRLPMHSAIIRIEIPDRNLHMEKWSAFNDGLETHLRPLQKEAHRLAENIWQVNFQKSPAALAWIVATADKNDLIYKILTFDAEPQWLPVA